LQLEGKDQPASIIRNLFLLWTFTCAVLHHSALLYESQWWEDLSWILHEFLYLFMNSLSQCRYDKSFKLILKLKPKHNIKEERILKFNSVVTETYNMANYTLKTSHNGGKGCSFVIPHIILWKFMEKFTIPQIGGRKMSSSSLKLQEKILQLTTFTICRNWNFIHFRYTWHHCYSIPNQYNENKLLIFLGQINEVVL